MSSQPRFALIHDRHCEYAESLELDSVGNNPDNIDFTDDKYHVVVDRTGKIDIRRALTKPGFFHRQLQKNCVSVYLDVDYSEAVDLNTGQRRALYELGRTFYRRFRMKDYHWVGHSDLVEKSGCPGPDFPIQEIRMIVKSGINEGDVSAICRRVKKLGEDLIECIEQNDIKQTQQV